MASPKRIEERSPRILLVRLSAIGDVIHTMPLACALRARFPQAFLAWVAERPGADLLHGHEALDELVALPRGWLKSPRRVWQLRRQLRAWHFDVAIEAQGLTKTAVAAWLSGTRRRIGFGGRWGRELAPWLNTERINADGLHAVQRNLRLLQPLGIDRPAVCFRVPRLPDDCRSTAALLEETGVADRFALMIPGAGWPSKLWPARRYTEVAAYLGSQRQLASLILWGNREEKTRAEQIVAGAGGYARLAPRMTLAQLAETARRAVLCVGSDTGPLHLAAAVDTPCVGLYGPWPAEMHGPYGPQHICVQKMCLEGTTRQRRHASSRYMEAIDVTAVCAACDEVLARRSNEHAT
ncbi:MAG: glycosyltransferase family 9 protein [Thermoguttaceae bacterium]|jgi:lipopolysaccharide heptosyltransferase I